MATIKIEAWGGFISNLTRSQPSNQYSLELTDDKAQALMDELEDKHDFKTPPYMDILRTQEPVIRYTSNKTMQVGMHTAQVTYMLGKNQATLEEIRDIASQVLAEMEIKEQQQLKEQEQQEEE